MPSCSHTDTAATSVGATGDGGDPGIVVDIGAPVGADNGYNVSVAPQSVGSWADVDGSAQYQPCVVDRCAKQGELAEGDTNTMRATIMVDVAPRGRLSFFLTSRAASLSRR